MNTIRRFFVLALLLLPLLYQWYPVSWNDDVQSRYLALEQTTEQLVKQTASFLEKQSVADSIFQFLLKQEKDNAIYTYVFKDNRLLAWNDNQLQVTSDLLKIPSGKVILNDYVIIVSHIEPATNTFSIWRQLPGRRAEAVSMPRR